MELEVLAKMRREARGQKILLLITFLVVSAVFLLFHLASLSVERSDDMEAAGQQPGSPAEPPVRVEQITEPKGGEQEAVAADAVLEAAAAAKENAPVANLEGNDPLSGNACTISGVVLRKGHDTPVRSLRLRLVAESGKEAAVVRAGADGSFIIKAIEKGRYLLHTVSENFTYQPLPVTVAEIPLEGLRFEVQPNPPAVSVPRYIQFLDKDRRPSVTVGVFRFGSVDYKLFRLNLAELFNRVTTLEEILATDTSALEPVQSFRRSYSYPVAFTELSESLDFQLDEPGLYLLEASAGGRTFQGLISFGSLELAAHRKGDSLEVRVLGDGGPGSIVKVIQDGRLIEQGPADFSGLFNAACGQGKALELMVSNGTRFGYAAEPMPR
jgi:hypothetical protein